MPAVVGKWARSAGYVAATSLVLLTIVACSSSDSPADPGSETPSDPCNDVPSGIVASLTGQFIERPSAQPSGLLYLSSRTMDQPDGARRFVQSLDGGNLAVFPAPGHHFAHQYEHFVWNQLGAQPRPGSVSTYRIGTPAAAAEEALLCRLRYSHGVWLVGYTSDTGGVHEFVERWPQVLRDSVQAARARGASLGGTIAGMMSFGEMALDAREGMIESVDALQNPLDERIRLIPSTMTQTELDGFVLDFHHRSLDREGRLLAFLAHMKRELPRDTVYALGVDSDAAITFESGTFRMDGESGNSVFVYRYTGESVMEPGEPLTMNGIERVELRSFDSGQWPITFEEFPLSRLRVDQGVILPDD
jgi:cyanophycinase